MASMDDMEIASMADVGKALKHHESRSQARYEQLMEKMDEASGVAGYSSKHGEMEMSEGINTDKVIVNAGGSGDGGGGMQAAALVAALGQRNQPMMGGYGGDGFGFGGGGGLLGGLLFGSLLGRRGGLGGGDDCNEVSPAQAAMLQTLMEGQSDLRAQVPTTALETQNAIQSTIAQLALGTQQGFANTKDAVQALALFQTNQLNAINQNVSDQGCKTRELVQAGTTAVLQRMDDLRIRELESRAERAERQAEVNSLRSQVEITNTNTATATATQAQFQAQLQFQDINNKIAQLCGAVLNVGNQVQLARNANETINFGTMAASGIQTTPTTQVR